MSSAAASYDRVPYVSQPYSETHPDHLGTIARLFGLSAAASAQCRVLELGCASGGNLLPMACSMPEARFVGVDISTAQITAAQAAAKEMSLGNVEFHAMSIERIDDSFGKFDYIIAHGVLSWVPPAIQDVVFRICRDHLAASGVALISYNLHPGWHMRRWVREMMVYHASTVADESQRVKAARRFLALVAQSPMFNSPPLAEWLKGEVKLVESRTDEFVVHEYLEDVNEPIYFHEFAARAAAFDLQYLGDGRHNGTVAEEEWAPAKDLFATDDLVRKEQYADFLGFRGFRRSLVCHKAVKLDRAGVAVRLRKMHVASPMRPSQAGGQATGGAIGRQQRASGQFMHPRGGGIHVSRPLTAAALTELQQVFPMPIPFEELVAKAAGRASLTPTPAAVDELADELASCWALNLVEIHTEPPRFTLAIGASPTAFSAARRLAARGVAATTVRHEMAMLEPAQLRLLALLDGTRDRDALARLAAEDPQVAAHWPKDAGARLDAARKWVDACLVKFAGHSLLVA